MQSEDEKKFEQIMLEGLVRVEEGNHRDPAEARGVQVTCEQDPRFEATEFLVETEDTLPLWLRFAREAPADSREARVASDEGRVTWVQENMGWGPVVGRFLESLPDALIREHPVVVSCAWALLNGRRVLFWEATSKVVDHRLIDAYFERRCPRVKRAVDSKNFHNVVLDILGR